MEHQSTAPGPEVGWGVGLVGFIASVLAGWFLDAGVGFVLFLLIFWGAVGALFAFLVERSTIEEHDRVDELQNTRLGTLAQAPAPVVGPSSRSYRDHDGPRSPGREAGSRSTAPATGARSAERAPGSRSRERETAAPPPGRVPASTGAAADSGRPRPEQRPDRGRGPAAARACEDPARARARAEQGPVPSRDAGRTGLRPDLPYDGPTHDRRHRSASSGPVSRPRSPREYREAKLEASRRDHSAA